MSGEGPVAVIAALVGNLLIAAAKLVGGLVAGSSAMLAEAAHSFSDVGNQVLLLIGIRRAAAPPTERHPFGTTKSQYFWPMMVAVLLFGIAGGYSLFEGIQKLRHPHPLDDVTLSLVVLAVAFAIEATSLAIALRQAVRRARAEGASSLREFLDENRDATILTVIVEDSLALVSLPLAAAAIETSARTGDPVYDAIGSIVIGTLLMAFALFLGTQIHAMLIGIGLKRDDLDLLHKIIADDIDAERAQALQSMHLGPHTALLGAEIVLRDGLDQDAIDAAIHRLESAMREAVPSLKHIYLEPHV